MADIPLGLRPSLYAISLRNDLVLTEAQADGADDEVSLRTLGGNAGQAAPGNIGALAEKTAPVGTDLLLLAEASGTLKKVQVGNMPGSFLPAPVALTPAQITADQNNYNPASWLTADIVRLSSDAARNVTGANAAATQPYKHLINVGAFNITLQHQNAGSLAENRFICFTGADIILQPDDTITVWYDATTARWRVGI